MAQKIGIFGTGVVAQTIGEKLQSLGHEVMLGTRNVEATMARTEPGNYGQPGFKDWKAQHPQIKLGTYREMAAFGELLINATQGAGSVEALNSGGKENLSGKVLLDIANPLDFSKGMPPSLTICNTDSLGETIQRTFPNVKVVKSLNTMNAFVMVNPSQVPGDHSVFVSGNDADAKEAVKSILRSFGWKAGNILDMGDISTARGTEQLLPIWVRLWMTFQKPYFNFHVVFG